MLFITGIPAPSVSEGAVFPERHVCRRPETELKKTESLQMQQFRFYNL